MTITHYSNHLGDFYIREFSKEYEAAFISIIWVPSTEEGLKVFKNKGYVGDNFTTSMPTIQLNLIPTAESLFNKLVVDLTNNVK